MLKNELDADPLVMGYAGKTDQEVADLINAVSETAVEGRQIARETIDTWEIVEATVPSEWTALSAAERQRYQTITGCGRVNVKGTNVKAQFLAMFTQGTTTRANLAALQNRPASRAEFLGFGTVESWDVARARAL